MTITEYGDFNCPACRAWYQAGIIERVLVDYPDQVRFEFRHFPVITPRSPKLAEAAECALDQGKFWEMHDILYDFSPTNTTSAMKGYAAQIGLDRAQFDECLDSGQYANIVQAHQGQAFSLGFRGTPSFSVNGQPLVNPSPETLRNIVEQALVASQ